MAGYQRVIIMGNLGRDPEVRYAQSGKAVCTINVAVTERKDGETEWFRVVAFDKTAETSSQYLKKGSQVCVEGRLRTREYEKDGEKKKSVELIADRVVFVGAKRGDGAAPSAEEDLPF
jgi:single-strand DNA-binding protein